MRTMRVSQRMLGSFAAWAGVATWVFLALPVGCGGNKSDGGTGGSGASTSSGKGGKGGSGKGGSSGSASGGDAGSGDTTGDAGSGAQGGRGGSSGSGTGDIDPTALDPGADGSTFDGVTLNGPELVRPVTGCDAFDADKGTLTLTLDSMQGAAIIRATGGVITVNSKTCVAADGKTKATTDAVKSISVTGGSEDDTVYVDGSGDYGKTLLGGDGFVLDLGDGGNDTLIVLGSSNSDEIRFGTDGDAILCDFNADLVPDVRTRGADKVIVSTGAMPDIIMGDGTDLGLAPVAVPMKLFGGGANDLLVGGSAGDEYNGGIGNDTMLAGRDPGGSDVFAGNDGEDFVDYAGRTAPITATLASGADDGEAGEYDNIDVSVENVRGGDGDDQLTGNASSNKIWGGAGNDVIIGGEGDDFLYGDDGDDQIQGQAGDDFIYGDAGNDVLAGGDGDDLLDGGDGVNSLDGGASDADICIRTPADTAVACEL